MNLRNSANTTPTPLASPATELSPDESQPAVNPDETTMWSVTPHKNETYSSTESSTEDYGLNGTSTATTTTVDISNLSYKQSNHSLPLSDLRINLNFINYFF
jgi:hypothetical protein